MKMEITVSPSSMDNVIELLAMEGLSPSQERSVLAAIRELVYHTMMGVEEEVMADIYNKIFMAATNTEQYISLYHQIRKDSGL